MRTCFTHERPNCPLCEVNTETEELKISVNVNQIMLEALKKIAGHEDSAPAMGVNDLKNIAQAAIDAAEGGEKK